MVTPAQAPIFTATPPLAPPVGTNQSTQELLRPPPSANQSTQELLRPPPSANQSAGEVQLVLRLAPPSTATPEEDQTLQTMPYQQLPSTMLDTNSSELPGSLSGPLDDQQQQQQQLSDPVEQPAEEPVLLTVAVNMAAAVFQVSWEGAPACTGAASKRTAVQVREGARQFFAWGG